MRHLENGRCLWQERLGLNTNIFSISCVSGSTINGGNCPIIAICGWDGSTFLFDKEQNLVRFKFEDGDVAAFEACSLTRKDDVTGELIVEICLIYVTLDRQIFMYTISNGYFANGVGVDSLLDVMSINEREQVLKFIQALKSNSSSRKNFNGPNIASLIEKASDEQLFSVVVSALVKVAGEEIVHSQNNRLREDGDGRGEGEEEVKV